MKKAKKQSIQKYNKQERTTLELSIVLENQKKRKSKTYLIK